MGDCQKCAAIVEMLEAQMAAWDEAANRAMTLGATTEMVMRTETIEDVIHRARRIMAAPDE